ncbi:MAG: serine/threonine-protein phosphatase [Gemmatimonadetes bacterium]|nr:serine/threonine-protein phosphatase [Gemmatimonadota bacterium]MBK7349854.1 serine/threonine-protein phosphatase [Gemmatimonadota bacterium]MBK7717059.1 serine/threonine-protein phosphatase [Gemmatimonadota bacterium]MBK7784484.1 serine/threonine-protein phosphatase [Gemmatimonadota bacterium]MBK7925422.1 serine/threonine-protein phosphatase [Gemmatimonadota bacterium]
MTEALTPERPHSEQIDVFGVSHPGRVRTENQDHFLVGSIHKTMNVLQSSLPEESLGELRSPSRGFVFLVADGVGGVPGGQEASRTALRAIVDYVLRMMDLYVQMDPDVEPVFLADLVRSVQRSHEAVRAAGEGDEERAGMATTLTMVCIRWPRGYLVHVGDSRCYRLREGKLELLTRDQTMAQAMVDAGALSEDQAERSSLKHVLYSALGATRAEPFTLATDVRWDDVMLLCSDGVTKHVTDDELREALLRSTSAEATARELLALALERGGSDNTTLIVGRLRRPAQP